VCVCMSVYWRFGVFMGMFDHAIYRLIADVNILYNIYTHAGI